MSSNRRLRESPPEPEASDALHTFKGARSERRGNATQQKPPGGIPRQEIARQSQSRDSQYTTRSYKCIPRRTSGKLTDSQPRMDSREECYYIMAAWEGQDHG